MRTHDLSPLLESNLQTPLLVKSLGIEGLHHLLGVYVSVGPRLTAELSDRSHRQIVNSPYTRTCIYPQPTCPTVDVYGFLCIPPLASVDASSAFEGNPCQCEPPAAYYTNRRRLAKQGHPSAISRAYSPNETVRRRYSRRLVALFLCELGLWQNRWLRGRLRMCRHRDASRQM